MAHSPSGWLTEPDTSTQKHAQDLLKRFDAFCSNRGWSDSYFAKQAGVDDSTIARLRDTGRVTLAIVVRLERSLAEMEKGVAK
ncbi:hypothetical protein [Mesobacterium pallidum]|uniref:hypothetical protein n=1 Tax=Mesobacterium pallidum TaxID=2872037 RepID=UPI001EE2ACCA|nr:hypothetical protein [Mesobacterium pallidum]